MPSLDEAISKLRGHHGPSWSMVTALQLLSGRRGQFAAECAPSEERVALYFAHLLSQAVCHEVGLGAVALPSASQLQSLRELAQAASESTAG